MFTPDKSDEIRKNFPMLSNFTFLNSASLTPLPAPTRNAMIALLTELSESAYLKMEEWEKTIRETRKLAAKIVNCSEEEVAFIRNTSDGISLVASGFPWKAGDEVIINDLEFPSNVYPWLNLTKRGVRVTTVKNRDGRITLDSIADAVSEKTKIVAISTVQFSTGFRSDIAALGQMAKERGFLLFVDAIQSLGVLPMDVKKMGIDFLSCGGHKWLCAPEGIGIFFCDESRLDLLELNSLGWNTVKGCLNFSTIDFTIKENAGRFEEGTPNLAGIYGLKESLKLLMKNGIEQNRDHVFSLNNQLIKGLLSKGYKILSPLEDDERSGITIFTSHNPSKNSALVQKLNKEGVLVMERGDGIRVAPHFFNIVEDIEHLLDIV